MAKFCTWCGSRIDDDDLFCSNCGKRADGRQPPVQPQPQQQGWQAAPQPQAKKSGGKGMIIGIVAAVVVVAAVAVTGFVTPGFFRGKSTPEPVATMPAGLAPEATAEPEATRRPVEISVPLSTPAPTEEPYANPFSDVKESDWFYSAVMWAARNGIVSGDTFSPNSNATRAQAMTFLWRASGSPKASLRVSPYTDVQEGDYYYEPVLWGFENGLISTSSDGQFHADGTLNRAQTVTFLYRLSEDSAAGLDRAFADVKESDWYYDAANWAYKEGIVGRGDDWSFDPNETVTRAQFVTFMDRDFDPNAVKAQHTTPENRGFEYYNVPADVDNWDLKYFSTITSTDETRMLRGSAVVLDYKVFDVDSGYPMKEGYEWRCMKLQLAFSGEDYQRYHAAWTYGIEDYYNIEMCDDTATYDNDGNQVHTIICDGKPAEITLRSGREDVRDGVWVYTWEAQVPKGYDGVVVGFYNREFWKNANYIYDIYNGSSDYALFRMKS